MAKDALFEIGLEELPARFIDDAQRQLHTMAENFLKEHRILFESVQSFSTPRRLSVLIYGLSETQTTIEEEIKGPAEHIARDQEGGWTKAAIGFTKGQGMSVEDIYTKDVKGAPYIYVKKRIQGQPTRDLLSEFKTIIESIEFKQSMRWGNQTIRYGRPIRWLVALYGSDVVSFDIAGVSTGSQTYGHRFLGNSINLSRPGDYVKSLKQQYVIVTPEERERMIMNQIDHMKRTENIHIPVDRQLLQEVRNLVEYPTVFKGAFDASFLQLPQEVLITSMKEHQRYFPVTAENGTLKPYFIGVRNGDDRALDTVIKGNEKVLNARLEDAQFFYKEDQNMPLAAHLEKLERVVFQEKLGSLKDKVDRIETIAGELGVMIGLNETEKTNVARAAAISKFDLMTQMVNEFTELQGIMGEDYALKYGENPTVARAIKEHYLPKGASGPMPENVEGAILSIADKLDTITGSIAAGLKPSASQDPYGLRRQATAVLRILKNRGWTVEVEALIRVAVDVCADINLEQFNKNETLFDVIRFFHSRAEYVLRDYGIDPDVIQATIHEKIGIYPYTIQKAQLLAGKRHDPDFKNTQEALVRVINISRKAGDATIDPQQFQTDSERALYETYLSVRQSFTAADNKIQAEQALSHLEKMTDVIHMFFDDNMVMTDDRDIRNNRLALLRAIAALIFEYADLSMIEWKQHF